MTDKLVCGHCYKDLEKTQTRVLALIGIR
ncbi:hypothetical protein LCGC14_0543480, partial [marine sediment metagenome]